MKYVTKLILTALGVFLISLCIPLLTSRDDIAAASATGFNAGNIMSDAVMRNKNTMTEAQIQAFLKSKNSCNDTNLNRLTSYTSTKGTLKAGSTTYYYNLKNGRFVCMADESFNGESAAHIIWQAAQDYTINPQVLIVLLQKEQGLVTDTWPNTNYQYAAATGYDCPDSGNGCNNANAGFKTQIRKATALFNDVLSGGWTNYPVGSNSIQYNPSASCGSSKVTIQNRATSSLYRYTPYQPNRAALAAGYGTGDSCSAYGNRNFYLYFTDWFGATQYTTSGAIGNKYNQLGGMNSVLGNIAANMKCGLAGSGCSQQFQNGMIYWSSKSGAYFVKGGIHTKWRSLGGENGRLGYPIIDEVCGLTNGGCYQAFQSGQIYWSPDTGAVNIWGGISTKYRSIGAEYGGILGYPTTGEVCGLRNGGCYQNFQNGSIYWAGSVGAHYIKGGIRTAWSSFSSENGRLGYPTTDEKCGLTNGGCAQHFEGGSLYWSAPLGTIQIWGGIGKRYKAISAEQSALGFPQSTEVCGLRNGGCYQQFDGGTIVWSSASGTWESVNGPVRNYWLNTAGIDGMFGYPSSSQLPATGSSIYQQFIGGRIYHSASNGTHATRGGIGNKYIALGGHASRLGLPINDETLSGNTYSQIFQGGTIFWKNGTTTVVYK